jgi:hypothetical protein
MNEEAVAALGHNTTKKSDINSEGKNTGSV